jgi:hypothetical protein
MGSGDAIRVGMDTTSCETQAPSVTDKSRMPIKAWPLQCLGGGICNTIKNVSHAPQKACTYSLR